MRTGKSIIYVLSALAGLILSCVAVQARLTMPQKPIIIEGAYPAHFNHVLHRSMEVPCGECHHNDEHIPRTPEEILSLTDPDELHCNNCHNSDFENTYLQSREEIFHVNCRACHAVGINGKRGPRKCDGCHVGESQLKHY